MRLCGFLPRTLPLVALVLLSACGGSDGPSGPDPDQVTSVTVSPTSATVEAGETVQLSARATNAMGAPVAASFSWSSSAPGVATVSASGVVTGVAAGPATVSASADGVSGSASIVVVDPSPPEAPTGLTVSAVSHVEADLSWTDASDDETGFEIQREVAGDASAGASFETVTTVGSGVTTFSDTGLEPATEYRWRVRAVNGNGGSAFAGPVEAATFAVLSLESQFLPSAVVAEPYEATLTASGGAGAGSFVWSLSGTLPGGMSFSEEGVLSGTPDEAGSFDLEITVASGGQSATRSLELTVLAEGGLRVVTTELATGVVGESYTDLLEATGGDGTYEWSLVSGSWPAGLSLSSDGAVSGTPTAQGQAAVTVRVVSAGESATGTVSVTVVGELEITTTGLTDGRVGAGYLEELQSAGGIPPVTWSVAEGAPPPGLSLDPEGVLSGTPSQVGSFSFTARVTDSRSAEADAAFEVTVDPGPVTVRERDMDGGQVGTPYALQLEAQGGDGTGFTWSLAGGTPPPGLTLASDGLLSGTPTSVGTFQFIARASSAGRSDTRSFVLTAVPRPRPGYQVDLAYLTPVSPAVRSAFESAQDRWSELITGDEVDEVGGVARCGTFHPATQATVDDVYIYVKVEAIDGAGGTLGRAGPCFVRDFVGYKALTGVMRFDEADVQNLLNNNLLDPVILHEMGHVLGIGVFWDDLDLRVGDCLVDPIFTGAGAIEAFNAADGTLYSGDPVPVEDTGSRNDGSNCSHWRESVMDSELMTPFLDAGTNPLSAITVESLGDMGYTVDAGAADPYFLPQPVPAGAAALRSGVALGDDVIRIPLRTPGPDGTPRLLRRPR